MSLEERAKRAAERAELIAAGYRQHQEDLERRAYEAAKARTLVAFQEHINQWSERLEVQAPTLRDVEYERKPPHMEPVHIARACFTIDGIEFRAGLSMRNQPDVSYGYSTVAPMYFLYVFLLRDKTSKYRIDSIQMLGTALRMTKDG